MNVFVYGSLMHPDEIRQTFGKETNYRKCVLTGYVRDFSKKAHSWGTDNSERGVLGLMKANHCWCNGLLIFGLHSEQINSYYKRETGMNKDEYVQDNSGYLIKKIEGDRFYAYDGQVDIEEPVLTAIINDRLDSPETNEEYRRLCNEAAKKHGGEFHEDFTNTTFEFYQMKTEVDDC